MKPEKIHSLNNSFGHELRRKAYQLTGSNKASEDITMYAFAQLLQNSFWIWSETGAKRYLNKIIERKCKEFVRPKRE